MGTRAEARPCAEALALPGLRAGPDHRAGRLPELGSSCWDWPETSTYIPEAATWPCKLTPRDGDPDGDSWYARGGETAAPAAELLTANGPNALPRRRPNLAGSVPGGVPQLHADHPCCGGGGVAADLKGRVEHVDDQSPSAATIFLRLANSPGVIPRSDQAGTSAANGRSAGDLPECHEGQPKKTWS